MPAILESPEIRDTILLFTVSDYNRFGELGVVDEKVELIEGLILSKMFKSPLHSFCQSRLEKLVRAAIEGKDLYLSKEEPITCSDHSEPEPDLAVVDGDEFTYRTAHPRTAKLVIEIAISSETRDRNKAGVYAEAGVAEVWIALPEKRQIVVHRDPDLTARLYRSKETISVGFLKSTVLPNLTVDLAEIF